MNVTCSQFEKFSFDPQVGKFLRQYAAQHCSISQFGNSDYDALWDGVTGDIMHKPNRDIPRDPVTNFELPNWLIRVIWKF